ncbi:MAG: hypothetical protein AAGF26_02825 [Cyanobacteria bacterium P01_G01_bin.49]
MKDFNQKRKKSLSKRVDEQVDKIVYKVMTNDGLEQTISRAVVRALLAMVQRYFILIAIIVILLLFIQSILIAFALKIILDT